MLQLGDVIEGKYRITRLLGQGGMGAVYEGENVRIHRRVAIKVLHAAVAAKNDVVQRFEREAQAAGRIGSQHIVEVLDLGNLPSGERFMVMEYLDGESLGDRIKKRKRLTVQEVGPIMFQLLEGLAAAHQAGIIHRDLKPDNVYLCQRGNQRDFVKILDFGVSKFSALDHDSLSMTKTGAVMGTPYYMSPEQARGTKIDQRSDLYSVGVVMYQSVTGRVPFAAETFNELVFKIALESPEPAELVVPDLEPGFASIIARAMVRDPNQRFQTANDFQVAIGQWMQSGGMGAPMAQPSGPGMMQGQPSYPQMMPYPATTPQGGVRPADASGQYGALGMSPAGGMQAPQVMSTSGMSASGRYGQTPQPGAQQLGVSQAGLAMTAQPPRGSGAMIAIGLFGTVVVAAAAFGAYKLFASPSVAAQPPPVVSAPAVESATPSATAPDSAAPPVTAPPIASAEPPASATGEPASTATKPGGKTGPVVKKGAPSAAPTAGPGPAPKSTGRVIGGEL